jgi:plasmid stabilization system protein ParE
MRVEFSSFIESDLETIGDYIARDNPIRAATFVRELREKLRHVSQNPFLYQLRLDIGRDARIAVFGRYIILFRIIPGRDIVRVERVVSGYRDLPALPR